MAMFKTQNEVAAHLSKLSGVPEQELFPFIDNDTNPESGGVFYADGNGEEITATVNGREVCFRVFETQGGYWVETLAV